MFTCETCGKTASNKSNFNKHLRIHTDKGQECPTCQNKFANVRGLTNHQKTVHSDPDTIFECQTCKETFKSKENFMCSVCNKNFNSKNFSSTLKIA